MMAKKKLVFGMVGAGMMGRVHSMALANINKFFPEINYTPVLKTVCQRSNLDVFVEQFGWQKQTHDWHEVVNDPEIDVVINCVPGTLHAAVCIEAAKTGKHVFCEKPLARNYAECMEMVNAVKDNKVASMVNFNYRRVPAVQLAKHMIEEGRLGQIVSYKGFYQNDWGLWGMPMGWKYSAALDGEGPQQNGIHILDLGMMLMGDIKKVVSQCNIIILERPNKDGVMEKVTNDDETMWLAKFENGVQGMFESTRVHAGHRNQNWFEVNGTKGSIKFELERLNELQVFMQEAGDLAGWKTVLVTEKTHPYIKYWWPAGHLLGWEHTCEHTWFEFLKGLQEGYQPEPSFETGAKATRVLEAIVKSCKEERWVSVDEING